jgi:hypothetical protein
MCWEVRDPGSGLGEGGERVEESEQVSDSASKSAEKYRKVTTRIETGWTGSKSVKQCQKVPKSTEKFRWGRVLRRV